ncbi:MAG: 4-hydroxyphenyl-beta-ketoacyl-CoA hydrolase, partial [Acidimicrobiales bacterium]
MPGPVGGIDLDALVAIDVHTHAEVSAVTGRGSLAPELERAADEYFGIRDRQRPTVEQMAAYYRERRMMAVVFTVDATTAMGVPPVPNDEIAEAAHAHPDVLIPFGSVDPHLGRAAVR